MIHIIDYQMGNLRSVQKAFERVGTPATITDRPADLETAQHVVLPGVGAFPDAMRELQQREWVPAIEAYVASGRPLLGICLGMQLLLESSAEFGRHPGLGIVPGTVEPFDLPTALKVPHMGWNLSEMPATFAQPTHPVFEHLADCPDYFYYVHSFVCQPTDATCVALQADYGGWFAGALAWRNIVATQFHPEKSQSGGLELLRRFAQWQPAAVEQVV